MAVAGGPANAKLAAVRPVTGSVNAATSATSWSPVTRPTPPLNGSVGDSSAPRGLHAHIRSHVCVPKFCVVLHIA